MIQYVAMVKELHKNFEEAYKKMIQSFRSDTDLDKLIHLRNVLYLQRKAGEHLYITKIAWSDYLEDYHTVLRPDEELDEAINRNFNKALENRGLKRQTLGAAHMKEITSTIKEFRDFVAIA